jgi:4-aminobutyrate aminotransferase-like enzyme
LKTNSKGDVSSVIIEGIQGVGGWTSTTAFFQDLEKYAAMMLF